MGEDEDTSDKPSRKSPKKKINGSVKQPQGVTSESQNEIDGDFNNAEVTNDDDDDGDDDENESGGILDILDGTISTFMIFFTYSSVLLKNLNFPKNFMIWNILKVVVL